MTLSHYPEISGVGAQLLCTFIRTHPSFSLPRCGARSPTGDVGGIGVSGKGSAAPGELNTKLASYPCTCGGGKIGFTSALVPTVNTGPTPNTGSMFCSAASRKSFG